MIKKVLFLFVLLNFSAVQAQTKLASNGTDSKIRIAKYKGDRACAVSYTFDDGLREHFTKVLPEFEKRGLKATFWIVGSKMNLQSESRKDTTRMSWDEIKQMADKGMEMSSHGWAHKNVTKCTPEQLEREVTKNDSAIYFYTKIKPVTYCFPGNRHTPEIVEQLSKDRVGVRTQQRSIGSKVNAEILDKWIADLIKNNEWGVGMTHGITYGYDAFTDPSILWNHLDKVQKMQDQVWVGTFREVMVYTKEAENTKLTVSKSKSDWLITPETTLDKTLFKEPLTAIVDLSDKKVISIKQGGEKLHFKVDASQLLFDFDPNGEPIILKFK